MTEPYRSNLEHLEDELALLRGAGPTREAIGDRIAATRETLLRLPWLARVYQLAPLEYHAVVLALAPELDDQASVPAVRLALRDQPIAARDLFHPCATLFAEGLLQPAEGTLADQHLHLEQRISAYLLGSDVLDARLLSPHPLARWKAADPLPQAIAFPEVLLHAPPTGPDWRCVLIGPTGIGKKTLAHACASRRRLPLLECDLRGQSPESAARLVPLAIREARLYSAALYLDGLTETPSLDAMLESFPGLLFLGLAKSWGRHGSNWLEYEVPLPDKPGRIALWRKWLPDPNLALETIAVFRFTPAQIERASAHALHLARNRSAAAPSEDDVLTACRTESSRSLISFATRSPARRNWDALVLPKQPTAQLRELCAQVRHRHRVHEQWGFADRLRCGKGVVALFTGPSGTGKTLAAEVISHDLGLDLFRIDLSAVVSKYIGETEKNLARVFDDAEQSNVILFFDEADALFGKRTDIKDSHDRYANIEINYLLQRLEDCEGVVILATNLGGNVDEAFQRRMSFTIDFPFPDAAHRRRIWRGVFPAQAPVAPDVDFDFLSRTFDLSGGNIRNIALAAAFGAADNGGVITMEHLVLALRREYQKLGRVCERHEFGRFYELVR